MYLTKKWPEIVVNWPNAKVVSFLSHQSLVSPLFHKIGGTSQVSVGKVIFLLSWQVFRKFGRDRQDILIFWDRKSRNRLFFNFFSTKVSDFISNLNDNCSQLSFQVYNVFVAQKLPISEFLIEFFFAWTLATSAASRGRNFNLSNLKWVSNFSKIYQLSYEILFAGLEWKWGVVRLRFSKWVDSTGYLEDQKARVF